MGVRQRDGALVRGLASRSNWIKVADVTAEQGRQGLLG
jgi:hypothetical protein